MNEKYIFEIKSYNDMLLKKSYELEKDVND